MHTKPINMTIINSKTGPKMADAMKATAAIRGLRMMGDQYSSFGEMLYQWFSLLVAGKEFFSIRITAEKEYE